MPNLKLGHINDICGALRLDICYLLLLFKTNCELDPKAKH